MGRHRGWSAFGAAVLVVAATLVAGPVAGSDTGQLAGSQAPAAQGYWMTSSGGGVYAFGQAGYAGSPGVQNSPVVGAAATPTSNGYWLVSAIGGVYAYGDAPYLGGLAATPPSSPIVGIAGTPSGQGYWLVGANGAIYPFGDATSFGSLAGWTLAAPVVGIVATPTGNGYWLAMADGGVANFGDATYHGSMAGKTLSGPVVGLASTGTGNGYWLVSQQGGIYAFGDAQYYGSMASKALAGPVVGMSATSTGAGYILVSAEGGIYCFGDAPYKGSMSGKHLAGQAVAVTEVGPTVGGHALLVGTFNGIAGQYSTIQAAVNAARPGDWILVAPGDYHEDNDIVNPPSQEQASQGWFGGVEINTPDLHLRGMNRNSVVVDGTNAGAPQCSGTAGDQNFGAPGPSSPYGRNGILIWKANNVSVENLTVCNFLTGSGSAGNGVWWNGGAGSGKIGLKGYAGRYLTATSTYYADQNSPAGGYGIFSSDSQGPGIWNELYASNMNDSGTYIGACQQLCDAVMTNSWMEYNALGYSGTNSGGILTIQNSMFDNNQDGLDTNTQIGGDPPAPQNGACPNKGYGGFTGTTSCWVFRNNFSFSNNNPNVPAAGSAAAGPTGTGMTVSGGTNDTVMGNVFAGNGAWGILFVPYPDSDQPSLGQTCAGTGGVENPTLGCIYNVKNDALLSNTFRTNGFFGNPSNSDFGQIVFNAGFPQNCFVGNDYPDGSAPPNLEQIQPVCGPITTSANTGGPLLEQVLCDTGFGTCPPGANYPQRTGVHLQPLPANLPTMPNPCVGAPANAWCPNGSPAPALGGSSARLTTPTPSAATPPAPPAPPSPSSPSSALGRLAGTRLR
jgi:hypothetical protein